MASSKILAGAHLKVYVNGQLLGVANGFNFAVRSPVRINRGIDQSTGSELIPTTYDVTGTIQVYRGRWQGGAEGLGMAAFGQKLLEQRYSTIEIVDIDSDAVVAKFIQCLVPSQSWEIRPKGLVVGNFSFEGLDYSNETEAF